MTISLYITDTSKYILIIVCHTHTDKSQTKINIIILCNITQNNNSVVGEDGLAGPKDKQKSMKASEARKKAKKKKKETKATDEIVMPNQLDVRFLQSIIHVLSLTATIIIITILNQ